MTAKTSGEVTAPVTVDGRLKHLVVAKAERTLCGIRNVHLPTLVVAQAGYTWGQYTTCRRCCDVELKRQPSSREPQRTEA
jgi:hypothetical protein